MLANNDSTTLRNLIFGRGPSDQLFGLRVLVYNQARELYSKWVSARMYSQLLLCTSFVVGFYYLCVVKLVKLPLSRWTSNRTEDPWLCGSFSGDTIKMRLKSLIIFFTLHTPRCSGKLALFFSSLQSLKTFYVHIDSRETWTSYKLWWKKKKPMVRYETCFQDDDKLKLLATDLS